MATNPMHFLWLALLVTWACAPSFAQAQDASQEGRITVSGEAVVKVTPDRVTMLLGIETWDKEMEAAKLQNNTILRDALAAIQAVGVEESDIQTDHLSIEPRYESSYRPESFIGYFVRNALSVTLEDPAQVEALLTGVLEAGVTHIHGINFETTDFKTHRQEARRLALEAAREKAEQMAAVLGKTIGEPVTISEGPSYGNWFYYGGGWGHGYGQGMAQNVVQNAGGPGGELSDTVALGKISIRGSVQITFTLE